MAHFKKNHKLWCNFCTAFWEGWQKECPSLQRAEKQSCTNKEQVHIGFNTTTNPYEIVSTSYRRPSGAFSEWNSWEWSKFDRNPFWNLHFQKCT